MTNLKYTAMTVGKTAAAAIVYIAVTVYLYQPQFKKFDAVQYLLVLNVPLACLGCFVLSQRWIATFAGSFFCWCNVRLWSILTRLRQISSGRGSFSSRHTVAFLPGFIQCKNQVAVVKLAIVGFTLFVDIGVFSDLQPLSFVRGADTSQTAFSRFGRPGGSAGYGAER